eukprot:515521-Pyramimonas_sp.AAC.1
MTSAGKYSAHPHYVVAAMEAEYKPIWRSSTEAPRAWIPDRSSHRRAELEDIRRAARTFPST